MSSSRMIISMISKMNSECQFFSFPRSLIWEYKWISSNFLSIKIEKSLVSSFCLMGNWSIWMDNPEVNNFLISWANVPSASYFWRNSWDVFIKGFLLSWSDDNCQHVFRFKITHLRIPFIHNCLLINFSVWNSIFNLNVCLNSLCVLRRDSESFLI